jgi:uncharacterized membrane protein YhaH (DUF805 family)
MGEAMNLPKTPVGWIGMSVLVVLVFWVGISDNPLISVYGFLIIILGIVVFVLIGLAAAVLTGDRSERQAAVDQMKRNLSKKGAVTGALLKGVSAVLPITLVFDVATIAWKLRGFLLSFTGRASRKMYWRTLFLYFVWAVTTAITQAMIVGLTQGNTKEGVSQFVYYTTLIVAVGPIIASAPAIGVKRLHDINKSGWWLLLFYLVPAVCLGLLQLTAPQSTRSLLLTFLFFPVTIWAFIELGCRRGTLGPNKYGDPVKVL